MTEPAAGSSLQGAAATQPAGTLGGPPDEPEVLVQPTPEDVAATAAERIVTALGAAIEARGRAEFMTTGGSTPVGTYDVLSWKMRDRIDWTRVHFWWGDDRFVPRDHPLSNVQAADSILFSVAQFAGQAGNLMEGVDVLDETEPGLVILAENIHPFPCTKAIAHSLGTAWCAAEYEAELRAAGLPLVRGFPVFDVALLGVGPDGHVLSVFPGSEAFERSDWAMAIPAPTHVEPHVERVTLNPAVLGVARSVLMLATGRGKADAVGRIFSTERDVRQLPAQLVRHRGATWILDSEAAASLPADLARR